ncbi:MAG: NTP transferase domain-containing protein [Nitrospinota bacterium]|nr:NTP transferase domain-containing protein [Nitrospinota bacterium]
MKKITEMPEKLGVVIMAAGKGTRMKSDLPKALHMIGGKPLVMWVVEAARPLGPDRIVAVVGHEREMVMERLAGEEVEFAVQEPQLGTGHALACAGEAFYGFKGVVLVLSADVPAIKPETLERLLEERRRTGAAVALLTCRMDEPGAYGRIIRREGEVEAIVEARDATAWQLATEEINAGIYAFDAEFVFGALGRIDRANAQGEYYLTDIVAMASAGGGGVAAVMIDDPVQILGVNTVEELAGLERVMMGQ